MGIVSTDHYVNSFYWRNVDANLNGVELQYLVKQALIDETCERFLQKYAYRLSNGEFDVNNLAIVLSQIEQSQFERLIRFFEIIVKQLEGHDMLLRTKMKTFSELSDFIGDNVERFDIFITCVYFYV